MNMKLFLLSVLVSVMFSMTTISAESNVQEPVFKCKYFNDVLVHLEMKGDADQTLDTGHYTHKVRTGFWGIVSHDDKEHKFILLRKKALFLIHIEGAWKVYRIQFAEQDNPITQLWHVMFRELLEFDAKRDEKERYLIPETA